MKQGTPQRLAVTREPASLLRLPIQLADSDIVAAIRAGQPLGGAALYDQHHAHVRSVLLRILGPDTDLGDLVQEAFLAAIDSIHRLEDPDALRGWLASICVHQAYREIRRRSRSRWFFLTDDDEQLERPAAIAGPEVDEAVRATYRVLRKLPVGERIAFSLRFIGEMELVEVAEACQLSLATTKRRLARARKRFTTIARTYPELADWVARGEA
jgi:RNA polymerase sigma-70 factor (ECF subfamily)